MHKLIDNTGTCVPPGEIKQSCQVSDVKISQNLLLLMPLPQLGCGRIDEEVSGVGGSPWLSNVNPLIVITSLS